MTKVTLRQARMISGFTQSRAAKESGKDVRTIRRAERDPGKSRISTILVLAALYNISSIHHICMDPEVRVVAKPESDINSQWREVMDYFFEDESKTAERINETIRRMEEMHRKDVQPVRLT